MYKRSFYFVWEWYIGSKRGFRARRKGTQTPRYVVHNRFVLPLASCLGLYPFLLLFFLSNFYAFFLLCFYAFLIFALCSWKSPNKCYFYAEKAQLCYFMLAKKEPGHAGRIASKMDVRLELFELSCGHGLDYWRWVDERTTSTTTATTTTTGWPWPAGAAASF